eukprot:TRINITY_DN1922_c0_g1_i1.p1 TRINITY_DN1922_c0_g1~~TRINITY_DN1922_c0_g1_i1.p1  ORF type:complete len:138 (-),score=29.07 TRINITY_DN1922_c0_g1_i1:136-549(-)
MSEAWDTYIKNNLVNLSDGHVDSAAVIGVEDSIRWTTDRQGHCLKLTSTEISNIVNALKSGNMSSFYASGLHVGEMKFNFLRGDERMMMAKKKEHGGLYIQRTKRTIIVAHYPEGKQPGTCNQAAGKLCDWMEQNEF